MFYSSTLTVNWLALSNIKTICPSKKKKKKMLVDLVTAGLESEHIKYKIRSTHLYWIYCHYLQNEILFFITTELVIKFTIFVLKSQLNLYKCIVYLKVLLFQVWIIFNTLLVVKVILSWLIRINIRHYLY